MLSIEHIMTSMMNGHTTDEKEYIAAVIFPDAIRAYTKDRELSHFEENPKNRAGLIYRISKSYGHIS